MTLGFLFALAVSTTAMQTATPVCDRFSNEEVSALFGAVKQKNAIAGPDSCTWTGENRMLTVMRTVYGGLKADEILPTLRKLAEKALAP